MRGKNAAAFFYKSLFPLNFLNAFTSHFMTEITVGTHIDHEHFGRGVVVDVHELFYTIDFGKRGAMDISKRQQELLTVVEGDAITKHTFTMDELEATLRRVLESYSDAGPNTEIGGR